MKPLIFLPLFCIVLNQVKSQNIGHDSLILSPDDIELERNEMQKRMFWPKVVIRPRSIGGNFYNPPYRKRQSLTYIPPYRKRQPTLIKWFRDSSYKPPLMKRYYILSDSFYNNPANYENHEPSFKKRKEKKSGPYYPPYAPPYSKKSQEQLDIFNYDTHEQLYNPAYAPAVPYRNNDVGCTGFPTATDVSKYYDYQFVPLGEKRGSMSRPLSFFRHNGKRMRYFNNQYRDEVEERPKRARRIFYVLRPSPSG